MGSYGGGRFHRVEKGDHILDTGLSVVNIARRPVSASLGRSVCKSPGQRLLTSLKRFLKTFISDCYFSNTVIALMG